MLSLRAWAAINISYNTAMQLEESEISIMSIALIEPVSKMDLFIGNRNKLELQEELIEKERHVCRIEEYKVRGLVKTVQGRSACWCYCPGGDLCNCSCAALLTILMEYRENQRWRTKGPNIPELDLNAPIKNYLMRPLHDSHLFHNVRNSRQRFN